MLLTRAIHHGCSRPFQRIVEKILPGDQLQTGLAHRDIEFCEVFAGEGHLSQALGEVACLGMEHV